MDLKEAITVLVKEESIGDYVYSVRSRAVESGSYKGDSWDHPRVKRFGEAVARLEAYLREGT